jgi:cyclopropane fatty-acyl-phospholipid synthase-like methyltransferase
MFSEKDISDYYQHTAVHYKRFWKLGEEKSLHYGFWKKGINTFAQALQAVNDEIIELANINEKHTVLDAGCGVGGSSTYIAKKTNCKAIGITLNESQKLEAEQNAVNRKVENNCSYEMMNYCHTAFDEETFDTIWGVESICHATDKREFLQEAYRLLKPNGTLIVIDFFKEENINDKQYTYLKKWLHAWAIDDLETTNSFMQKAKNVGFTNVQNIDKTEEVKPSARKIYYYALLGWIGTKWYTLFHKNATHFGRVHAMSGIVQYKSLKQKLWNYQIIVAKKN